MSLFLDIKWLTLRSRRVWILDDKVIFKITMIIFIYSLSALQVCQGASRTLNHTVEINIKRTFSNVLSYVIKQLIAKRVEDPVYTIIKTPRKTLCLLRHNQKMSNYHQIHCKCPLIPWCIKSDFQSWNIYLNRVRFGEQAHYYLWQQIAARCNIIMYSISNSPIGLPQNSASIVMRGFTRWKEKSQQQNLHSTWDLCHSSLILIQLS